MSLLLIAAAAFLSTFAGGYLAFRLQDKLHLILGFSAGAVIGVAFFDLLPEALDFAQPFGRADGVVARTALGFFAYLAFDRLLLFHGDAGHRPAGAGIIRRGSFGAGILSIHSFLDGAAIGFAFKTSPAVGWVVAVAVLTHDFSDGINTMNIVRMDHGDRRRAFCWLLVDALAPAAGIASTLGLSLPRAQFGGVLAVFAGFFLYIGASDLIPESYHAHPQFLTTAMTLAGAAVLYAAVRLIG